MWPSKNPRTHTHIWKHCFYTARGDRNPNLWPQLLTFQVTLHPASTICTYFYCSISFKCVISTFFRQGGGIHILQFHILSGRPLQQSTRARPNSGNPSARRARAFPNTGPDNTAAAWVTKHNSERPGTTLTSIWRLILLCVCVMLAPALKLRWVWGGGGWRRMRGKGGWDEEATSAFRLLSPLIIWTFEKPEPTGTWLERTGTSNLLCVCVCAPGKSTKNRAGETELMKERGKYRTDKNTRQWTAFMWPIEWNQEGTHIHTKKRALLYPSASNISLLWHTGLNPSHLSFGEMCPALT